MPACLLLLTLARVLGRATLAVDDISDLLADHLAAPSRSFERPLALEVVADAPAGPALHAPDVLEVARAQRLPAQVLLVHERIVDGAAHDDGARVGDGDDAAGEVDRRPEDVAFALEH